MISNDESLKIFCAYIGSPAARYRDRVGRVDDVVELCSDYERVKEILGLQEATEADKFAQACIDAERGIPGAEEWIRERMKK